MKTQLKKFTLILPALAVVAGLAVLPACQKTASQKVEDKAEDVGHNVGQAGERAGEAVKDATN